MRPVYSLVFVLFAAIAMPSADGLAQSAAPADNRGGGDGDAATRLAIKGSGLAIPRFVSLKTGLANMRSGPGAEYPVKWQYRQQGLPVKVIGEFEHWRRVEDHEGETGWMHKQLLSGRRMVLVTASTATIRRKPGADAGVLGVAEKGVMLEAGRCNPGWCHVSHAALRGWIARDTIWGVLAE